MKISLVAIPLSIWAACAANVDAPPPASDGAEGLSLSTATPERLTGSFVDPTGRAILFDVARTSDALYMDVRTGGGHTLVHAETLADAYRFEYLDARLTLTVDKAWVDAIDAAPDDSAALTSTDGVVWDGDRNVLDEMLAVPEVQALPLLSRALGVRGYTGQAFPASLALHKIARQSADALGITVPPLAAAATESYCSQPTANECYGMCGPGCTCWSWVCGDCCYHHGCAVHDSWCRDGEWYWCYNITAVIALFGC